jgi:hypothetical protein
MCAKKLCFIANFVKVTIIKIKISKQILLIEFLVK